MSTIENNIINMFIVRGIYKNQWELKSVPMIRNMSFPVLFSLFLLFSWIEADSSFGWGGSKVGKTVTGLKNLRIEKNSLHLRLC